jgi:subtilisin family serine protease
MRRTRMLLPACVVASLAFGPGCLERSPTAPTDSANVSLEADPRPFVFLSPLSKSAKIDASFDATLAPLVRICELSDWSCVRTIAEFTTTSGTGSETVRVDSAAGHYIVNWHTDRFQLETAKVYRIAVYLAGATLGVIDVVPVATGRDLKSVGSDDLIALLNGRTLPIKFWIGERVGFPVGPDSPPDSVPSAYFARPVWTGMTSCGFKIIPHMVTVYFHHGSTRADRQAAFDLVGGEVVGGVPFSEQGFFILRVDDDTSGEGVCAAVRKLEELPSVRLASPEYAVGSDYQRPRDGEGWTDWVVDPLLVTDTARQTWALESIAAPLAWGCAVGDPSTRVAVIDHGFHVKQIPDLLANVNQPFSLGLDIGRADAHGTTVAGIIAAAGGNQDGKTGVMWAADLALYDRATFQQSAEGLPMVDIPLLGITTALRAALNNSPRVVNISAGFPEGNKDRVLDEVNQRWRNRLLVALEDGTVNRAIPRPMPLVVVTAGNTNEDASTNGFPLVALDLPDHIIVVANSTVDRLRYPSSSHGPLVTVYAPGTRVAGFDRLGGIQRHIGTSFAAPHVTGLAGLLFSFDPWLEPGDVKRLIVEGAARGARPGDGVPIINAYESLKAAAREAGSPICGNRVWAADRKIVVERGGGARETIATLESGVHVAWDVEVLHGGKHLIYQTTAGARTLRWDPLTRAWGAGALPPNFGQLRSGTNNSMYGESHDRDTTALVIPGEVLSRPWYQTQEYANAQIRVTPAGGAAVFTPLRVNRLPHPARTVCLERAVGSSTCTLHVGETHSWLFRLGYPQRDLPMIVTVSPLYLSAADSTEWAPCSATSLRECRNVRIDQKHAGTLVYALSPKGGEPEKIDSIADGAVYWVGQSESDKSLVLGRGEWQLTRWVGANHFRQTGSVVISNHAEISACAVDYRVHDKFKLDLSVEVENACNWQFLNYPSLPAAGTIAPSRRPIPSFLQRTASATTVEMEGITLGIVTPAGVIASAHP